MPVEIRVPQLGESVVEATVTRWHKREGESVTSDEILVDLETDKVNVEVPAGFSGTLATITRKEGDTVGVNELLGMLDESAAASNGATSVAQAAPYAASTGTAVASSPGAPVLAAAPIMNPVTASPAAATVAENGHAPNATPVAVKMAADNGVDLAVLRGSGANGKITIDDVKGHLQQGASSTVVAPIAAPLAGATNAASVPKVERATTESVTSTSLAPSATGILPALFQPMPDRGEERIPMSRRRQAIAINLVKAQQTAAMLTTFNEVDMTAIMDVRKRRKDTFKEKYGVNLGFMSFFVKAVIGALKEYPRLNAEIQGTDMVLKKYYDIGIAVGVEEGLVVPVVRDADRLTFAGIEREIGVLAAKARENKLTLGDMQGGTFTITNGGVFGSLMSTPILNAPQVGILGMHKIEERAMVVAGEIVIRPMMYLALSYDHRIVDGSESVKFLVRVKALLEDPESLLLEG